jgi:type IV secretory pathway VirB10-like protein
VEVTALQEMHNQFREKMDAGLKSLAENQGKNGLPKAPDTSTVGGEAPPPQADNDAATELQDQQKDAEQAEQETQETAGGPGGEGGR